MNAFCTVITSDYAHYAIALYHSYQRYTQIPLHVLCIDWTHNINQSYAVPSGMTISYLDELQFDEPGPAIIKKYSGADDMLRWSLKAIWLMHLLKSGTADRFIFIDPDCYFFGNPDFLFEELKGRSILLSPHWRSTDPEQDAANFEMNFRDGIYNGGFLGATISGIPALQWLASACLYKCEITPHRGLFCDQKYYDLLPSRFSGVASFMHKGCNVANWNQVDCKRVAVDHKIMINGTDPIVFVHFTRSTIRGILNGTDSLLSPFLKEYEQALYRINPTHLAKTSASPQKPIRKRGILQKFLHLFSTEKFRR